MYHPLSTLSRWPAFMSLLRDFVLLLRASTPIQLGSLLCGLGATYLLYHFGLGADMSPGITLVPIAYPLAFAVNTAYYRRDDTLDDFANLRATSFGYYSIVLDLASSIPGATQEIPMAAQAITELQLSVGHYVTCKTAAQKKQLLLRTYKWLFELGYVTARLRELGAPPVAIAALYSACHRVNSAFEHIRDMSDYRTPGSIRSYAVVFCFLTSVLLAPHFASLSLRTRIGFGLYGSAVAPIVFSYLLRVQQQIEVPFDGDMDDIKMSELAWWPSHILRLARMQWPGSPPAQHSPLQSSTSVDSSLGLGYSHSAESAAIPPPAFAPPPWPPHQPPVLGDSNWLVSEPYDYLSSPEGFGWAGIGPSSQPNHIGPIPRGLQDSPTFYPV